MGEENIAGITEYLSQFVTENKKTKIARVLENRTRHITLALENIFQSHNASATLRTCELLGVQDIHVIEHNNAYSVSCGVARGSAKWVTLRKYGKKNTDNTAACYENLRSSGYKIYAASPHKDGFTPDTLPLYEKAAVIFGTEEEGLTDYALSQADGFFMIPMYGFTESFNVSVSVGIAFSRLIERLRASDINWGLTEEEKAQLTLDWYRRIVKRSDLHEEKLIKDQEEVLDNI